MDTQLQHKEAIDLETYGKGSPPDPQRVSIDILKVLNQKVKGELPFIRACELRRRVCGNVKAPSFFALLKDMEKDELLMVCGVDMTWAECAVWDHPKLIAWRIELERFHKEMAEIEEREREKQRLSEIENAPRLARERFQRELGEFFSDNSEQLSAIVQRIFRAYMPKRRPWLHSREPSIYY